MTHDVTSAGDEADAQDVELDDSTPLEALEPVIRVSRASIENNIPTTSVNPIDATPKEKAPAAPGGQEFSLLHSLLSRSVFFDYFAHVAETRYAGDDIAPKVRLLVQDSRKFYRVVLLADLVVRGLVTAALIAGGAWLAAKSLWPLPWMG